MIPFQKIFTLVIRTFSKPLLSLMKKKQQEGKYKHWRWFFVGLGRKYQIFEHWLNHKLLKTTHKKQLTELKEEILMEKGIEGFYEIFFYSIVIGLPMYELYKGAESAEKKEIKLKAKVDSLEHKLDEANQNLSLLLAHLTSNTSSRLSLQSQREERLKQLLQQSFQGSLPAQQ